MVKLNIDSHFLVRLSAFSFYKHDLTKTFTLQETVKIPNLHQIKLLEELTFQYYRLFSSQADFLLTILMYWIHVWFIEVG